jgi:hypothetical protein
MRAGLAAPDSPIRAARHDVAPLAVPFVLRMRVRAAPRATTLAVRSARERVDVCEIRHREAALRPLSHRDLMGVARDTSSDNSARNSACVACAALRERTVYSATS